MFYFRRIQVWCTYYIHRTAYYRTIFFYGGVFFVIVIFYSRSKKRIYQKTCDIKIIIIISWSDSPLYSAAGRRTAPRRSHYTTVFVMRKVRASESPRFLIPFSSSPRTRRKPRRRLVTYEKKEKDRNFRKNFATAAQTVVRPPHGKCAQQYTY